MTLSKHQLIRFIYFALFFYRTSSINAWSGCQVTQGKVQPFCFALARTLLAYVQNRTCNFACPKHLVINQLSRANTQTKRYLNSLRGQPDSNRREELGRLTCYHYIIPAFIENYHVLSRKSIPFFPLILISLIRYLTNFYEVHLHVYLLALHRKQLVRSITCCFVCAICLISRRNERVCILSGLKKHHVIWMNRLYAKH